MAKSSQKIYRRVLSRKNQETGKSNYPTAFSRKQTKIKYQQGKKQVNNSNYRKIEHDKTN